MRIWLFCLAVMLCPGMVISGPWAREKGRTFLSFSATVSAPSDNIGGEIKTYGTVYMEHGLGRDLTLGLDAGMDPGADYSAILFLRKPVFQAAEKNRFSVQAGVGSTGTGAAQQYLVQLGASWGRGLTTGLGPGWVALDASAMYRLDQGNTAAKADLTIGVKPSGRTKLMLQVQAGSYPGSDPYLRLVPSVARKFGDKAHVELGVELGVVGDDRVGLKLGTWLEF